ncbi:ribosomal protein S7 domain-containing protein [Dendryphion nanum]|uniref:Small ribosomal subunit protein uS7m n=1 Tax=Dendryphion nanum TaxID=256645 RepID=A0A9P9IVY1_9PLEO|nr:ribosomal protein S7 domain-containing protein [Dendryphion nanum]
MPPRLSLLTFAKSIPFRSKPQPQWARKTALCVSPPQHRLYSDTKESSSTKPTDPTGEGSLPHVSEEAAKMAEITGGQGPDLSKGTPVEEVVKGDKSTVDKLPKVMQDAIKSKQSNSGPKGSRSYSTTTTSITGGGAGELDLGLVDFTSAPPAVIVPGSKFEIPTIPLAPGSHMKKRYDLVVDQFTNLLMRHGEKSKAQKNMSIILQQLRTSPIPTINPDRPLLLGAPPPSHLPLNPILYLTLAVDSIAPLMRIRLQKGAAGGGVALQIPVPLGKRQRRRTAIDWILSAASKKKGTGGFAQRVATELISVVEGKSAVWDRRNAVHKLGMSARSNLVLPKRR